ncbi:MAG: AI-2E family transporter [Chloroflexi bacterium]|nr:AI-2E family transporter [Chloroflexota bacterium]
MIAGISIVVIPSAFEQGTRFVESTPEFFADARSTLERWAGEYGERVPEEVRDRVQEWLESGSDILIEAGQTIALRTLGTVANVLTMVLGLAVVPLFLFFALKDGDRAIAALTRNIPGEGQRHATSVLTMVNQVFAAYLRAQLTLALFVAVVVSAGLFALGIPNALLLGVVAGAFEFVPIVGPLLGFIPGVLVTLAVSPENTLWVALLYGGVQAIQNALLVPRVQGKAVDLHPALIMFVVVVGSEAAGMLGVVLAVPVTAAARNVFQYFYREWRDPAKVEQSAPEATEPA